MTGGLFEQLREISQERARKCRRLLALHEKEIAELKSELDSIGLVLQSLDSLQPERVKKRSSMRNTILEILLDNPLGIERAELLAHLEKRIDQVVKQTSFNTTLWRLRSEDAIVGGDGAPLKLRAQD